MAPGTKQQKPLEEEDNVLPEDDAQHVELQDDLRPVERSQAMYLPAKTHKKWTEEDISFLKAQDITKKGYEQYTKLCKENKVPIRTYEAFWNKVRTLKQQAV